MDDLINRLRDADIPFDEELADEVVCAGDTGVFHAALDRKDCPPELTVDLSQSPHVDVRRRVAGHPSTPIITLQRMATDPDADVARAAQHQLANG